MLKRSRDDNSYLSARNSIVFDESPAVSVKPPLSGATTVKQPLVNPNYAKLVGRPCTPRYPIKPLNGLRKLRPRNSLARNKSNKTMVVSVPNRCPTPASTADDTAAIPDEAVNETVNNMSKNDAEESDTGCSSLDDDDDFDGKSIVYHRECLVDFCNYFFSFLKISVKVTLTIRCPNLRTVAA